MRLILAHSGLKLATRPQTIQCLEAGQNRDCLKIPMADTTFEDARKGRLKSLKKRNLVAMQGTLRRFNPSHQWFTITNRTGWIKPVQQMDVQTYFSVAQIKKRAWPSALLGQITCFGTIDATLWIYFSLPNGLKQPAKFKPLQSPIHPETWYCIRHEAIGMKVPNGAICHSVLCPFNKTTVIRDLLPLHLPITEPIPHVMMIYMM